MRAAYDALSDGQVAEIETLVAEHSAFHSRAQLDDSQYTEEERALYPPVQWPVVREHPGSKRKVLYIGVHAERILDRAVSEGRLLLAELLEHATQPDFVYRHNWRPGDLVIWDNRAVQHSALNDYHGKRREMWRISISGEVPV